MDFSSLISFLTAALNTLLRPINLALAALGGFISFLAAAVANPGGTFNKVAIGGVDLILGLLPSTPTQYKIATIISNLGSAYPLFGKSVIYEIFQTLAVIFGFTVVIKVYKLLPFTFK